MVRRYRPESTHPALSFVSLSGRQRYDSMSAEAVQSMRSGDAMEASRPDVRNALYASEARH